MSELPVIEPIDAARAGAEFLDEECPDWFAQIDLNDLDMSDCTHCILGQIYGWYDDGLGNLNIGNQACELGFDAPGDDENYDRLTETWGHEVRVRGQ